MKLSLLALLFSTATAHMPIFQDWDDCSVPNFDEGSYAVYMNLPAGETASCRLDGSKVVGNELYFSLNVPRFGFDEACADKISMTLSGPSSSSMELSLIHI